MRNDHNIQFDTDTQFTEAQQSSEPKSFSTYLINAGVVSTQKQAQYVLIALIVLIIIASFFILTIGGGQNPIIEDSAEEEIYYDGPNTLAPN